MKFPFYHNDEKAYTIDDANYECGRIIVADCPNSHRYATLCELVAECPDMKQLTKPCVVDFLNNLDNPAYVSSSIDPEERFLRIKNGCLEVASPCICNQDKYVIATDNDNQPGPLDSKVKGSCSYDGLYCIDIEEAGPQTLVRRPSGPNGPFINPDLPSSPCDSGESYDVKLKNVGGEWKTEFVCPEQDDKPQYAKCTYKGRGVAHTPCCMWEQGTDGINYRIGRTVRYYATRADAPFKPIDPENVDEQEGYIDGDWDVIGTPEAFGKPDTYGVIKIKQKGIYVIAFSSYITFNQVMKAIRCGLYIKNSGTDGIFRELNDIKYETGEYRRTGYPEVFNRTWPDNWDKQKFIKNALDTNNNSLTWGALWTIDATGLPFSRSYVVNVSEPTEIAMVVKPDTRGIDPRLIKEEDSDDRYKIHVEGKTTQNPFGAVTSIEIARIGDLVTSSRAVII